MTPSATSPRSIAAFGPVFEAWARSSLAKIAVTGATGWMGRAVAEMAVAAGLTPDSGRLRLFGGSARSVVVGGTVAPIEALHGAPDLGPGDWLILHFAFLGKEKTEDRGADAFMVENDAILQAVLRLAGTAASVRLVFASSGAVYGPGRRLVGNVEQSPYGYAKVLHEQVCAEWAARTGAPLAIPRIFNIGGPFINKLDRYALTSLIAMAQGDGPIRIASRRPTFRSFVHVDEMLAVIAEAALETSPDSPARFDTCGREIVEMGDLAASVAGRVRPEAVLEREWSAQTEADWYVGEARDYHQRVAALGRAIVPLSRIIDDTVASLGNTQTAGAILQPH